MRKREARYFVGDFETTVYEGQTSTEVWASACVELGTEDVKIFNSIEQQYAYFLSLNDNIICYYHNLKFDGHFWLSYLMNVLEYKEALDINGPSPVDIDWKYDKDMKNKTFKYSISNMGQWYTITIKENNKIIQFRDSLKLLPFSVKKIGDSFGTKHKKLDMEYTGYRYAGCTISDEEKHYIANDVLVVKEALELMFDEGHQDLTIGSCCLTEFKKTFYTNKDYEKTFPNIYLEMIDPNIHSVDNAGEWIRKSYKGGWCYVYRR